MRKVDWFAFVALLAAGSQLRADMAQRPGQLSTDFGTTALARVRDLAGLGERTAGTQGERAAVEYVRRQFGKLGLQVTVERFEFESFVLEKAGLHLGGQDFTPAKLLLNPYAEEHEFAAEAVWADPSSPAGLQQLEVTAKIVVTSSSDRLWGLGLKRPLAIVIVDPKDAAAAAKLSGSPARLEITGRVVRMRSANVVAALAPEHARGREVLLSAHLDSLGGPGANDNASGVGVLLALAEHFSRARAALKCPLRFVAFGAEEMGFVGSRAFVERHAAELSEGGMLINMDQIGGRGDVLAAVAQAPSGSRVQFPAKLRGRQLATEKWRVFDPELLTFTGGDYPSPGWLKDALTARSRQAGVPVTLVHDVGSDNVAFYGTGLPVVALVVDDSDSVEHTGHDTVDRVQAGSLAKVGAVVAALVVGGKESF